MFELYLRSHDRINNWDLVDRAAVRVVGEYLLLTEPGDVLYELARSGNVWQRRTAIVATHAFIMRGQLDDTYNIAELLIADENEYVSKAVGSWLREAGKKDPYRLVSFLDKHAATMPREALRNAVEKLDKPVKERFLKGR